ncbi:transposase [Vibrio sp. B1ASS3]|nr:transposase [Vibrio sp. B1ASS3]
MGVFCALHTYGRKLNWNCHVHAYNLPCNTGLDG